MAQRYYGRWNVIGADVFNEPFGATWAEGRPTDMDAFAKRAAEAIHNTAPNWLIFVEGASKSPNCNLKIDGDATACGYGDNLLGVQDHPLTLTQPNKLVYSFHTYGPSQHPRPEFSNARFPSNLPDVWEKHWGYIKNMPGSPAVVLGEWGGPADGSNGKWADALISYLTKLGMTSNFNWALNAGGSLGLITSYSSRSSGPPPVDGAKLQYLARLVPQPTKIEAPSVTALLV